MIVTAWNNGSHHKTGAGYGVKITAADRDYYFCSSWKDINICLPDTDKPIKVNIAKASFWGKDCRELISKEIGQFFLKNILAPWQKNCPPKFELAPVSDNTFELRAIRNGTEKS